MLNRLTHNLDKSNKTLAPNRVTPISTKNLSYKTNGQTLLTNLNIEIPTATKTIIMGANGAGKSLLLRILHGLIPPSNGSISWNGVPINPAIQAVQAMVFQRPVLLRRSAIKNIAFVLKHLQKSERLGKAESILEAAKLSHIANTPARLLSGGEQQRLAIARAMANEPKILFLDEPTASLDPASTQIIEKMIETAFNSGTKVILITHDIGQARRLADDIIFLNQGRLCEATPADSFFKKPKSAAAQAYLKGELFLVDPVENHEISPKI